MNQPEKKVALVIAMNLAYGRGLLRGIYTYARANKPWFFHAAMPDTNGVGEMCQEWGPDGIIGHLSSSLIAEALRSLNKPLVNVSGVLGDIGVPRVGIDDVAVGRMAARHFLERGFRNFAFLAQSKIAFSLNRQAGFEKHLESKGHTCDVFYARRTGTNPFQKPTWNEIDDSIQQWLLSLSKPVAVFANNDQTGIQVISICQRSSLRVPEDVAVLGVDDDELLCEMVHPPLSSVKIASQNIGYEAAQLLSRLMDGKRAPEKPILVPPMNVVTRQSTNVLAITDPEVANALRFIREHADEPIRVEDVLDSVTISRRVLENRFRSILERTPLAEIRRVHIERAKELLAGTDYSIPRVAESSGYNSAARFCVAFRAECGFTPGTYRKRFRHR